MNRKEKKGKSSTAFGRGIKRAARWVAKMFGYKAENKYARGVWYVFATCVAIFALVFVTVLLFNVFDLIKEYCDKAKYERMVNSSTYLHDYSNEYVSPYVIYHASNPCYLYNILLGKRTTTGIQWIDKASDGDSLVCFSTDDEHKCGYFNRFTGEVIIPARYDKAWAFSDGMACVLDKGVLRFIDHKGQTAIDKVFPYSQGIDGRYFRNGLCSMLDDYDRIGLIDKQGNWVVDPVYYRIAYHTKGFWLVQDQERKYGLLDAQGQVLLPNEYKEIAFQDDDSCIFVSRIDHLDQVLDFGCNVINPCDFREIKKMVYETDEYDEYDRAKSATANCLKYITNEYYCGLMDKDGTIITPPSYSHIEAIGLNRYHCKGPHGSVILDDKGRKCGEKL